MKEHFPIPTFKQQVEALVFMGGMAVITIGATLAAVKFLTDRDKGRER